MTGRFAAIRRWWMPCSLGLLLSIAAATTAAAASFELPPLTLPASGEHHSGKVVWADLVTPDLAGAEHFYGALFGWTFDHVQAGRTRYSIAYLDGAPIAGLVERRIRAGERRQSAWLGFLSVRDVKAAERIVLAHGGKVLSRPRKYAERGRQAIFRDPQGAAFAVLESSSGDPADTLAVPGDWIWSSLITEDPGAAALFYQSVFGYKVFDLPSPDGREHVVVSSDHYARASINPLPDGAARRHPHWLYFVRVKDPAGAAAKAQALGGRVIVEPRLDRHGGHIAVVTDPAGAPIGLLEWTATGDAEEAK